MLHMEQIGIRELRLNASKYLKIVAGGGTVEVTDRGRPVAKLVPIRAAGMESLIKEGRVSDIDGDLLDLEPLPLPRGSTPPSQILAELRQDER
jgi:prevent-host-death family protein